MITVYALGVVVSMLGIELGGRFPAMAADNTETNKQRGLEFASTHLKSEPNYIAPDGMAIRLLPELPQGGVAHFELRPGTTSSAVSHRTVAEIWYFLTGRGQMWRKQGSLEEIVDVYPGVAVTIPPETHFQVRSFGHEPLAALGVTMPPWPGCEEAVPQKGHWPAPSAECKK
jgi:mannose-6-phosphate isomerase-like protein (cupin superfamily)